MSELAIEIPVTEPLDVMKKRKDKAKKNKLRSAWISFGGRILSQIVGAIATVTLGVMVLHKAAPSVRTGKVEAALMPVSAAAHAVRPNGEISIAVLPLENFSGDTHQEYLTDGLTEALITDLSKIDSLHVVSRTSSMHFKGQRKALGEIAQELGVRWVIEGSVARSDQHVRVIAQLIDAEKDEHAWAETYDRTAADVLALQAEVADEIARAVHAAILIRHTGWSRPAASVARNY